MKYVTLPNSGLTVSRIGFGSLWIGGVSDEDAIATLRYGLDNGVTLIDTAEGYGRGAAEELIAKAVAGRRSSAIIATKGGLDWGQHAEAAPRSTDRHINMAGHAVGDTFRNSNPKYIRASIEGSLRRLKTDYIDLYQIHYPDATTPYEETLGALEKAKGEGKIRYIGVSNFTTRQMREWLAHGPIHTLQPPFNMLDRGVGGDQLLFCRDNGIGVLTYGSLGNGLLSGAIRKCPEDWRKELKLFKGDAFEKNLAIVDRLAAVAGAAGIAMTTLAVAWVLAQPGVTTALIGPKRKGQADDLLAAADCALPDDVLEQVNLILDEYGV